MFLFKDLPSKLIIIKKTIKYTQCTLMYCLNINVQMNANIAIPTKVKSEFVMRYFNIELYA
ncbi:hypothetical protein THOD04_50301 [Vibrio owensii]|nr:hypothetical protein THOD04_50301 [Vibrio owensii]